MSEYAQPLTSVYHERKQWKQESDRGVIIRNDCAVKPDDLMSRVVIRGEMVVERVRQHIVIGPIGSRSDYLTVAFGGDEAMITTGCFVGTIEQFEKELAYKEPGRVLDEYWAALRFIQVLQDTRCKRKEPEPSDDAPIAYA